MALRDQPYIPLYVQDYLTDEKLNSCSASSQGVYVKMMCVFHKSDPYGGILLKQKDKQNSSSTLNFVYKLSRLLPFDHETIEKALTELLEEKVLQIEGDFLSQKRMVHDNTVSLTRSKAGKKGGGNPNFVKTKSLTKPQTKSQQNPEYESEYVNEDDNVTKGVQGGRKFTPPTYDQVEGCFLSKATDWTLEKVKFQAKVFYDHYESNGWMVGKNKMKSYPAAVSSWINRDKEYQKTNNNGTAKTESEPKFGRQSRSAIEKLVNGGDIPKF